MAEEDQGRREVVIFFLAQTLFQLKSSIILYSGTHTPRRDNRLEQLAINYFEEKSFCGGFHNRHSSSYHNLDVKLVLNSSML